MSNHRSPFLSSEEFLSLEYPTAKFLACQKKAMSARKLCGMRIHNRSSEPRYSHGNGYGLKQKIDKREMNGVKEIWQASVKKGLTVD